MKTARIAIPIVALVLAGVVLALWIGLAQNRRPANAPDKDPRNPGAPIRLGLVPEHDIFALRKSYHKLANYLGEKLGRPVEIVTLSTYEAVLEDFREKQIEGAFLGSLVALLAIDRFDAQVLAKPEQPNGVSTYTGVIFVREDSPITSMEQLRGKRIAVVRTTTAGCLFAISQMVEHDLLKGEDIPQIISVGTHDEVVTAVMNERVDVGSVKNLRLDAYLKAHPEAKIRRLATSDAVPNNALVVRKDVAGSLGQKIAEVLKAMEADPAGREALAAIGARRFVDATVEEYDPIHNMIETVGDEWQRMGVPCTPPRRR